MFVSLYRCPKCTKSVYKLQLPVSVERFGRFWLIFLGICGGMVVFMSVSVLSLFRPDVHLIVPFVSCFQTYSRLSS